MKSFYFSLLFLLNVQLFGGSAFTEKRIYTTKPSDNASPVIDGLLTDSAWDQVEWGGNFTQRRPIEGESPSQPTAFKLLYDEKYLYVGIRAYDSEPNKIVSRMDRRDRFPGDRVEIALDSYFDKRTAFTFTISVSGVQGDEILVNNRRDRNWDAVWFAETAIDQKGWTAEVCIPLSQLRYADTPNQVWGLQVMRRFFRKDEHSSWQFIPQNVSNEVNFFGELHGLHNLKSRRQLALLPYTVSRYERFEKEAGNPFMQGEDRHLSFGLDGKVGLTSDIMLDFTINPDFGQVEADPSVVNLTAFETFFEEKRPFFMEGRNILDFRIHGRENLFYSRRIGRRPGHTPEIDDDEYLSMPDNTSILGAMKITGKTRTGLSIGVLESVTAREEALIDRGGEQKAVTAEPMSNYFLGRLQKDWHDGNTILGGMVTSVHRDLDHDDLNWMHRAAYSGGLDFQQYWKNKTYFLTAQAFFSRVEGNPEAILATQEASARYFQRPDADHVSVDSSLTQLSGWGGRIEGGKQGIDRLNYEMEVRWTSPGTELNDIGFLQRADRVQERASLQYKINKPFSLFYNLSVSLMQFKEWTFGGEDLVDYASLYFGAQFKNLWSLNVDLSRTRDDNKSVTALRGGPGLLLPGSWEGYANLRSSRRGRFHWGLRYQISRGDHDSVDRSSYRISASFRPTNALELSVEPSYTYRRNEMQYVGEYEYEESPEYVMAQIKQKTLGVTLRLNYCLTPDLTIQFYGQPFVSAGTYSRFKRITQPSAQDYSRRFNEIASDHMAYSQDVDEFLVDLNRDGEGDFWMSNPDFNFRQFQSNLVVRWQYRPGSTLYFVWSQNRTGYGDTGRFSYQDDINHLFGVYPHNVFLIKLNYWFHA